MAAEEKKGMDVFSGINFAGLEDDLGLRLPDSGESGKQKEEKKPILGPGGIDLSQKIEIPETEEEIKNYGKVADTKEVEKEEEEKEITDESGKEDALLTEDSPLYLHAATLHEEGILPTLDLESLKGKTFEEGLKIYLETQKQYLEDGRNDYKNSLSERQKNFLELIEKGVPEEQAEHQFTVEDSYGKITDEVMADDESLQEQLIINNLKLKGLSDAKVQVFLKAAKDDERLFEEAKEARDDINTYIANQRKEMLRKAEEEERDAERREQELIKTIKSTIDSTKEILPGIEISASEKTKLYDLMTKPVEFVTINGQKVPVNNINKVRSEDRVMFDLRLNYFIEQGMFKKDFDLTKLNKKLTSKAASKISEKLKDDIAGVTGKGLAVDAKKKKDTSEKIIFPRF